MNGKKLIGQMVGTTLCALFLVGCGTPTPTTSVATSTPQTKFTPTPMLPTSTPSPTQATTPIVIVTPTFLAGAGHIRGHLVYQASGKPASGYSIGLGTANFQEPFGTTPFHSEFWTESDIDGYFAFSNVTAGEWIVVVDNPLTTVLFPWERVTVKAGTTVTVELRQIDKDLKLLSPPNKSVPDTRRPVLRWISYLGAISYKVRLYHLSEGNTAHDVSRYTLPLDTSWSTAHNYISPFDSALDEPGRTTGTEISLLRDLPPGWYQWSVTAYNFDADTWAYCDCGGSNRDNNFWTFGIPGEKSLVVWTDSYNYSDKPQLSLYNNTGRDLTLTLVGYGTVAVTSDQDTFRPDKEIEISPGTYPYTATISNLQSISGTIVIGQKGPSVLTFYVSSSVSK